MAPAGVNEVNEGRPSWAPFAFGGSPSTGSVDSPL